MKTVTKFETPVKVDDNIEVTRFDQEKINMFSRLNQQLTDVETAIESRNKIVKDVTDATEIIEELQITDEDAPGTQKIYKQV
jgi:prefoldin subunit 4